MRLIPVGSETCSGLEDGFWVERPGFPQFEGSWIHPPRGSTVPEFYFEEGLEAFRWEPAPVFYIGSGNNCHIRLSHELPRRICRIMKEGRSWFLEALLPTLMVYRCSTALKSGDRVPLSSGDTVSIRPATNMAWQVCIFPEENQYIDQQSDTKYLNKYPSRFPVRSSLKSTPPAPEALKRLAWQTDQMRRGSEQDQVHVADWSAFSQYVKGIYIEHGIHCVKWKTIGPTTPIDSAPPPPKPRKYPDWIAQLLQSERQLPGLKRKFPMPFETCLSQESLKLESRSRGTAALLQRDEADGESTQLSRLHLRRWLENVDDSTYLLQYLDKIADSFDCPQQIIKRHVQDGEVDASFFKDVEIRKLGHKRLFEKWFRDNCSR